MKDSDVKKVLSENKKVIIPGLGMFMTSEYLGKNTIMFNPYLQINDGVLSKYLAEEFQISQEEALGQIESYVAELKSKINNGSAVIAGVGELSSKGDGAINFVQQEGNIDSTKNSANNPQEETETPSAPIVNQRLEVEVEVEEISSVQSTGDIVVEEKKESISLKFEIPKPAETENKAEQAETVEQPTKANADEQEKADIEALKKGAEKLAKEPKRRNKKRLILLIFLLVVVGGGATLVYLNLDEVKQWVAEMTSSAQDNTGDDSSVTEENQLVEDENQLVSVDEADISEDTEIDLQEDDVQAEVAPQAEQPIAKSTGATNQYHVIAGSFSVEENAINLVVQLNQKGYNAQLLGKFGSLYQVSAGASADKQAANDIAKKLKESENMDSWIRLW
jgi:cell division septation protein DedD